MAPKLPSKYNTTHHLNEPVHTIISIIVLVLFVQKIISVVYCTLCIYNVQCKMHYVKELVKRIFHYYCQINYSTWLLKGQEQNYKLLHTVHKNAVMSYCFRIFRSGSGFATGC